MAVSPSCQRLSVRNAKTVLGKKRKTDLANLGLAAWNLASAMAFAVGIVYAYRLHLNFRGGKLTRGYQYSLLALVVLFATFIVSILFNFADITTTTSYGISVRDLGILIAGFLFIGSLREASKFWIPAKDGSFVAK